MTYMKEIQSLIGARYSLLQLRNMEQMPLLMTVPKKSYGLVKCLTKTLITM